MDKATQRELFTVLKAVVGGVFVKKIIGFVKETMNSQEKKKKGKKKKSKDKKQEGRNY